MAPKIFKNIHQIGIVTRSARQTVKNYLDLGIGPWNLWEFGPEIVEDMEVKGKKINYSMVVATCKKLNVDFEIIEAKDEISIYYDFLKERGEGIQHLNYDPYDYGKAVSFMKDKGLNVTQFGNLFGKHRYIYFGTEDDAGHIIETSGNLPGLKRKEPEETFNIVDGVEGLGIVKIKQIGILVHDVNRTADSLNNRYGVGPWEKSNFEFSEDKSHLSHEPAIAVTPIEGMWLGLLGPGDNSGILSDILNGKGEGPQLVAFGVKEYEKSIMLAEKKGLQKIGKGKWKNKKFTMFDSRPELKFISCLMDSH